MQKKNVINILIIALSLLISCTQENPGKAEKTKNEIDTVFIIKVDTIERKWSFEDDPNYVASIHIFDTLIDSFTLSGTKFEVIDRKAKLESQDSHNETSLSLLIKQDGEIISEIFRFDRVSSIIPGNKSNKKRFAYFRKIKFQRNLQGFFHNLARIDFEDLPSAPGYNKIAFIQFEKYDITSSDYYSTPGSFETKNGSVRAKYWSGYFEVNVPLALLFSNRKIEMLIDSSRIRQEGHYLLFKINDSIKTASGNQKIEIIDNIFHENPSFVSLDITKNMEVKLQCIAIVDSIFTGFSERNHLRLPSRDTTLQNYFTAPSYWLKIKIGNKEGWTRSQRHYVLFGCAAAG